MKKFKVVITDREYENIDNELEVLKEIDADVYDYQYKDEESILKVAKDADAIIVQYAKMPASLIEKLENCKIVARYATGYDGIDLAAMTKKGIYFCNVPDYCSDEVSTHTLSLLLELSRRVDQYNRWTHQGNWFKMKGQQHNLRNQIIGVISFGKIAKEFIKKVRPLCNNIWVYSEHADAKEVEGLGAELKSFDEILEKADYLSIHSPLTAKTHHLFNRDAFMKMKNSSYIINVARGAVVSEEDLVWALDNKEIGGAALDVLENEPPEKENKLLTFDNVIITPHTGWYSVESQKALQTAPAQEIVRVYKGERPLNVVNKEVLR